MWQSIQFLSEIWNKFVWHVPSLLGLHFLSNLHRSGSLTELKNLWSFHSFNTYPLALNQSIPHHEYGSDGLESQRYGWWSVLTLLLALPTSSSLTISQVLYRFKLSLKVEVKVTCLYKQVSTHNTWCTVTAVCILFYHFQHFDSILLVFTNEENWIVSNESQIYTCLFKYHYHIIYISLWFWIMFSMLHCTC